ncbi:MAG: hypothetical protein QF890_14690 [Myxococcota bacterium]|jgi:hypothetical protein|nr:hypothetical protein [bacterium]MDP6074799.1 hypothetical protein [Myxococcota bacterium]MDP6244617.1 hypothetical protein [Myxococcota bacterium]MDP7075757.1 hypothetical protein [Myxococcota bacterium]MDP7299930.1 hypothetical protein [Myxococcota bacterium]|tara:strand:- start:46 stop:597 length:552 start_codon:yes stop_codon:yes gene_type:complete
MVCSTRRWLLALLVAVACFQVGCVTGKTFEGARLDESPEVIHEACLHGEKLRVRYTAVVTREFGKVTARRERGAEIDVAHLEERPRRRVDQIQVAVLDPEAVPLREGCRPVRVRVMGLGTESAVESEGSAASSGRVLEVPAGALHRDGTAGWVWPLLPITLALDTVATPSLAVLWVAYFAITD